MSAPIVDRDSRSSFQKTALSPNHFVLRTL